MSREYPYGDEKRRARVGRTYIVMVVGGLFVGLLVGGLAAWFLLKPRGLHARVESMEARLDAFETQWPERLEALESEIKKLRVEVTLASRRAEEITRLITEARTGAAGNAAARRVRPEPEGNPAASAGSAGSAVVGGPRPDPRETPGPSGLRLSGVLTSQGKRAALLEDGRDQAYVVQVGGALPGGRVVEISDDAVVIENSSGGRITIRVPR